MALIALLVSCGGGKNNDNPKPKESGKAKRMLQGIWVNDDACDVVFKVKGDTIFYPDTTSMPVYFQIIADTMVLHGASIVKYPIIKQSENIFVFANQNGEHVKLVRSEDPADNYPFEDKMARPLNQNELIKRDTVVMNGTDRYHCYVQVNPTTYKVVMSNYNDEGVVVDNIYYDNIVHLSIFKGKHKLFSGDFRKHNFTGHVPQRFLEQAILSDIIYNNVDDAGIHYVAVLGTCENNVSYEIDVRVDFNGNLEISSR